MPTVADEGYGPLLSLLSRALGLTGRFTGRGLQADALQAAADRAAGQRDQRPEELAAPLAALGADLAERPVTPLGDALLRTTLGQALVSRRRLQAADPLPAPRTPPVVIVGWYRTGTTYLQALLSALPGYGFVPLYRLLDPAGPPSMRARTALGVALQRRLQPELSQLHPVSADGPEECWALLATHLLLDGLSVHLPLPRFEAWLDAVDRRPAYQTWARALALLEAERGCGFVMKDPAHLRALSVLHALLPDARLIWTERDPAECVASFASLVAVQRRAFTGRVDRAEVGRAALRRLGKDLGRAAREGAAIPQSRLARLPVGALVDSPVAAVADVCARLDLPFDEAAVAGRAAALGRPRAKHDTSLALWGLTEPQVVAALESGLG